MVGLTTPVNERRLLGDDAMTDDSDDSLTLRVAKAIPSDVGHGRARVPFDNDLNLKPGDIIEISGERKTAAIVWRCRPEDANLGVIRVDGIIRKMQGSVLETGWALPRSRLSLVRGWYLAQLWQSSRR